MDKAEAYRKLVSLRKGCSLCRPQGLTNPSADSLAVFDSDQIGPWTRWQGNLDAKLLVIGQDWGDIAYFRRHQGGDDPHNRTNEKLRELLRSIGFELPPASTQEGGRGVIFITNAVLCLKNSGGLGAPVRTSWYRNCGAYFLKPTIEIVSPQAVVTLGRYAYFTLRNLFNLPHLSYREAVSLKEGFILSGETVYFPMYHCSPKVLNIYRHPVEQENDWQKLTNVL